MLRYLYKKSPVKDEGKPNVFTTESLLILMLHNI